MKILTREQFLEMPKGTVFRKVSLDNDKAGVLYLLDAEDNPLKILDDKPWVVDEDDGTIDYFYITLGCTMLPKDEQIDDNEAFLRMREGEQIDYTHIGERDGLFEDDDIGFAVYTEAEVSEMIERLKCSLEVLKCDSLEKGVTKELSKRDVIHMLRGTSPTLSGMAEAIKGATLSWATEKDEQEGTETPANGDDNGGDDNGGENGNTPGGELEG